MVQKPHGTDRPLEPGIPTDLREAPLVGGGTFQPHRISAEEARRRDRSAHRAVMGLWEDLE